MTSVSPAHLVEYVKQSLSRLPGRFVDAALPEIARVEIQKPMRCAQAAAPEDMRSMAVHTPSVSQT
jgi:hypothetical protein